MNWLQKLPHTQRAASGFEWTIWRKLPLVTLVGTAIPLACLLMAHVLTDSGLDFVDARWLQTLDFMVMGAVLFHWSMVATVAIGCLIVMVMKGPGYVADGYPLQHSDKPRATMQTEQEAASYRSP